MKNIIFNRNEYSQLPSNVQAMYKAIGGSVYALKPQYFVLDVTNLPKWLSREQYVANRYKIGNMYTLVTRGLSEAVPLMQLQQNYSYSIRNNYTFSAQPNGIKITEEVYHNLTPKEKAQYKRIDKGSSVFYVRKSVAVSPQKQLSQSAIRQPSVGKFIPPIGKWVEVR